MKMNKDIIMNLSMDQWEAMKDPDYWEYLDTMKDIRGFLIEDKEYCWKDFEEGLRKDETLAWELYEKKCNEDKENTIEEELYAKYVSQTMQWHHMEIEDVPYWKQCVDKIEEKLK